MYPEGLINHPVTVDIEPPAGWRGVATGLDPASPAAARLRGAQLRRAVRQSNSDRQSGFTPGLRGGRCAPRVRRLQHGRTGLRRRRVHGRAKGHRAGRHADDGRYPILPLCVPGLRCWRRWRRAPELCGRSLPCEPRIRRAWAGAQSRAWLPGARVLPHVQREAHPPHRARALRLRPGKPHAHALGLGGLHGLLRVHAGGACRAHDAG